MALVLPSEAACVPLLVTVAEAFATAAPDESFTVTKIPPESCWAKPWTPANRNTATIHAQCREDLKRSGDTGLSLGFSRFWISSRFVDLCRGGKRTVFPVTEQGEAPSWNRRSATAS